MNLSEFKKLQKAQMEIMDEVHRLCVGDGITYYIIGGTALGARRHGGFIPWDVDIDIAMPREAYIRFEAVCERKLSKRFIYRDYHNTPGFTHPHALVCIKDTYLSSKFSKYNSEEENLGIYLDVFPLDKAPEDISKQMEHANRITRIRKIKKFKRGYCYNNKKIIRLIKKAISHLIWWTNIDRLNEDFDRECRKYNQTVSVNLCSMSSHYKYSKQCMPSSVYGTPILVKFEDREYFSPELLDEYLTRIYGDFMKVPPAEEQKANLDVFDKVVFDK